MASNVLNGDTRATYETGVTLTEFTLFPKLPQEVQLHVQKLSMLERRVQIVLKKGDQIIGSNTTVPAILQVCRQWRVEASKCYELLLPENPLEKYNTYFNFEIDTLYFDCRGTNEMSLFCDYYATRETVSRIERVAVSSDIVYNHAEFGEDYLEFENLVSFKNLEDLIEIWTEAEIIDEHLRGKEIAGHPPPCWCCDGVVLLEWNSRKMWENLKDIYRWEPPQITLECIPRATLDQFRESTDNLQSRLRRTFDLGTPFVEKKKDDGGNIVGASLVPVF